MNLSKLTMMFIGPIALVVFAFAQQSSQISLRSVDGKLFDMAACEGRIVVMYFDGTWNPIVEKTIPALQRLSDQFSDQEVDFYWVSINSGTPDEKNYFSDHDLQVFAKEMRLSVPVLRDPEKKVFRSLKLDAIPTIVVFDRNGDVYCKITGVNPEQPDRFGHVNRLLHILLKN
jgi:thiol-disulfide isomerase/thioredoxin